MKAAIEVVNAARGAGVHLRLDGDGEFGQPGEWSHDASLDWPCLGRDPHRRLAAYVRDLNALYRDQTPMHQVDAKHIGFDWIDADNAEDSVIAFLRMGGTRATRCCSCSTSPPSPGRTTGSAFPIR